PLAVTSRADHTLGRRNASSARTQEACVAEGHVRDRGRRDATLCRRIERVSCDGGGRDQTRLRFLGRTPLCACGETSFTPRISSPAAWSERIAVSRPEPGPFTNTSTFCRPCSIPLRAAASAVT